MFKELRTHLIANPSKSTEKSALAALEVKELPVHARVELI